MGLVLDVSSRGYRQLYNGVFVLSFARIGAYVRTARSERYVRVLFLRHLLLDNAFKLAEFLRIQSFALLSA